MRNGASVDEIKNIQDTGCDPAENSFRVRTIKKEPAPEQCQPDGFLLVAGYQKVCETANHCDGAERAEGGMDVRPAWPMTLKSAALKNGGDGAGLSDQQPVVGPETPVRIRRSCRKHSAVTRTQTRLLTIGIPHPAASIVDLSARHPFELPIGSDNEDLVCGACGMVALAGWSLWSTAERLVVDSQMLIRCARCRTYNVVPTARLAEEPREALAMVHNRLRGLYIRGKSISCR